MDKRAPYPKTQVEFLLFYDRGTRCHNPFGRSVVWLQSSSGRNAPGIRPDQQALRNATWFG